MSGRPVLLPLAPHRRGTTWDGVTLTLEDGLGVPLDLTAVRLRMVLRDGLGAVCYDWRLPDDDDWEDVPGADSEHQGLSLGALPGTLRVQGPSDPWAPAADLLIFVLQVTRADGTVEAPVYGSFEVLAGEP